jgi:hypothetical protein
MAQVSGSITDINNNTISIKSLQGKKILLVVLPLQKDTAIINQLLRFQKKNEQRVTVIGLVTIQAGAPSKDFYKETYTEASQKGITITEGLATVETVADERESVIQWLTGKSNNRQLDRFANGSKYFLSEEGRLYAQLGKGTRLDDPLVACIVNTVVPKSVKKVKEEQKSTATF